MLFKNIYHFRSFIFFLVSFCTFSHLSSQANYILNKKKLDNFILTDIDESQKTFNWSTHSDTIILSGLINSDSLLAIGLNSNVSNIKRADLSQQNFKAPSWRASQKEIIELIENYYGDEYDASYIFPFGQYRNRPYVCARIFESGLLKQLIHHNQVRYTDPMTYSLENTTLKSDSGCSPVNITIEAVDTIGTSPMSSISWHNIKHNIELGWSKSNKGKDINIAVFDTGLSPTQSKLNSDFDEGESFGRTVVKKGFYASSSGAPYDGWQDQCGHGTAMSGLATAPKGFDNTPCGVAYQANLISYRCTEDVIINTAQEKNGVSESMFHAADTTVHIISMSLGDLFFNGMVADAIAYAEGKGKLIFAAAGTSTFFTNGFGVIFPADMSQTIAITGIKEGSAPFTRCETCHDGEEVDFVVEMERVNNTSLHGVTLGEPDLDITYVGGSSCATATSAGHAALIWSNDLSMNKAQVVDRMMRAANYYPNRDGDHGWGTIDLDLALSPKLFEPCDDSLAYSVSMEITNISFPPTSDGLFNNTAEWVIEIEGQSFFFEVSTNGDSDSPTAFLNNSTCGFYPMVLDLGSNLCGQSFINNVSVISHEDDGGASDCIYSSTFDDDYSSTLETVDFSSNTFTHNSSAGLFTFTYNVYCTPEDIPSLNITGDSLLCINGPNGEVNLDAVNGQPAYDIEYFINNGPIQIVSTDALGMAQLIQSTGSEGSFVYDFIKITDSDGCIAQLDHQYNLFVSPSDYAQNGYGALTGIVNYKADFETEGIIDALQIIDSLAQVDYDSGVEINLLSGFEIKKGAIFYGFIDGCNEGQGGLNIMNVDSISTK